MNKHKRFYFLSILFCMIFALGALPALASNGDGTGGGSGSNSDIALTLESSSVADGASGVALNETIQLNFNKNICNITVLPNNKKCFHLTEEGGETAAIRITFPDNQVQNTYRRQVFLTPLENLKENTAYRISVDRTLTAKNGTVIDNAHTITFTTGSKTTSAENKILKKLGDYVVSYELSLSETGDSVPVDKSLPDNPSADSEDSVASLALITGTILILIVCIFIILFILKRKRK